MAKKKWRKPHPAVPKYVWWGLDGCWFCKDKNGCSRCKALKGYAADQKKKIDRIEKKKALTQFD